MKFKIFVWKIHNIKDQLLILLNRNLYEKTDFYKSLDIMTSSCNFAKSNRKNCPILGNCQNNVI